MYTLLYKSLINVSSSSNYSTVCFNKFYIKHELKPIFTCLSEEQTLTYSVIPFTGRLSNIFGNKLFTKYD